MRILKKILPRLVFLLLLIISIVNCKSDDGTVNCVPTSTINRSINLSLPLYLNLNNPGGWVYIDGYNAGTRGLIVLNTSTGYKAYDRNAPHICPTAKSTLNVVDDIKIVCEEDGAEWILTTGQPIKVANRGPRTYQVTQSGNVLYITN